MREPDIGASREGCECAGERRRVIGMSVALDAQIARKGAELTLPCWAVERSEPRMLLLSPLAAELGLESARCKARRACSHSWATRFRREPLRSRRPTRDLSSLRSYRARHGPALLLGELVDAHRTACATCTPKIEPTRPVCTA